MSTLLYSFSLQKKHRVSQAMVTRDDQTARLVFGFKEWAASVTAFLALVMAWWQVSARIEKVESTQATMVMLLSKMEESVSALDKLREPSAVSIQRLFDLERRLTLIEAREKLDHPAAATSSR